MLKHTLATVAATAALLAAASPAYQHNQTDHDHLAAVTDGTSNTMMFGERIASDGLGAD